MRTYLYKKIFFLNIDHRSSLCISHHDKKRGRREVFDNKSVVNVQKKDRCNWRTVLSKRVRLYKHRIRRAKKYTTCMQGGQRLTANLLTTVSWGWCSGITTKCGQSMFPQCPTLTTITIIVVVDFLQRTKYPACANATSNGVAKLAVKVIQRDMCSWASPTGMRFSLEPLLWEGLSLAWNTKLSTHSVYTSSLIPRGSRDIPVHNGAQNAAKITVLQPSFSASEGAAGFEGLSATQKNVHQ